MQRTPWFCVWFDATIPALDSSEALKMVQDAGKLPQTILALTKADQIHDEESIVEHIFERVLGRSQETKDLGGLAGCVAVVNRLHHDILSVLEAEQAETVTAVFNAMFCKPAAVYAPKGVQQELRANTTSSQLIEKLNKLFSDHIVESWVPLTSTSIQEAISAAQDHLVQLGPNPKNLEVIQAMEAAIKQASTWQQTCGHSASTAVLLHSGMGDSCALFACELCGKSTGLVNLSTQHVQVELHAWMHDRTPTYECASHIW